MSNMSYCRFRNTLGDLQDCLDNLDAPLSGEEFRARVKLIAICQEIAETDPDAFFEQCDECQSVLKDGLCPKCDEA